MGHPPSSALPSHGRANLDYHQELQRLCDVLLSSTKRRDEWRLILFWHTNSP
jgi:hypothetical protein